MRLNRFYLEEFTGDKRLELGKGPILHQIKNVLKIKDNDFISLFDGEKECLYQIDRIDNKKVLMSWQKDLALVKKLKREIFLFQSIIKKDKMEWVVQKAVELGVKKFIPIISDRSEKKDINLDRLQKIVIEATEQCGRLDIMEILLPVKFKEALKKKTEVSFIGDGSGDDFSKLCQKYLIKNDITSVFIGPEGGWSPAELSLAQENSLKVGSLNNYTLRSETAAVAILSLMFNI